jgi:hypothetical protein
VTYKLLRRLGGIGLGSFLALAPAVAHDFFLLPGSFKASGASTSIDATVGSAFPTPEIVVTPDRLGTVTARAARGDARVAVVAPRDKALELALTSPGTGPAIVAVALKPRDVEYGEDRIDLILDEYHVSAAAKAAVAALPRPRTLKVNSRRFAKTVVCRATCDGLATVPAEGFELEFVPTAGGTFRLVEGGSSVAAYPVTIATRDGKRRHVETNAQGEIALPADATGPVMLFASTMATPSAPGERFVLRLTSLTTERP